MLGEDIQPNNVGVSLCTYLYREMSLLRLRLSLLPSSSISYGPAMISEARGAGLHSQVPQWSKSSRSPDMSKHSNLPAV